MNNFRPPIFDGSGGCGEQRWRLERMIWVLTFATGIEYAEKPARAQQLGMNLLMLYDHKGWLHCLWSAAETARRFGPRMTEAWEWYWENPDCVTHYTVAGHDYVPVFEGFDPNRPLTGKEPEWPGRYVFYTIDNKPRDDRMGDEILTD